MTPTVLTLMVYDVASDAGRARLHALLKSYGVPVQKSAFEARLTPSERHQLLARVAPLVDPATDRFTMYPVSREQEERILSVGLPRMKCEDPLYYLV